MWFIVEPLNNRHIILSIIKRLSSFRGKNVLPLYRMVHWKVSSIQRCPLFRVSFIRGSTVHCASHVVSCAIT